MAATTVARSVDLSFSKAQIICSIRSLGTLALGVAASLGSVPLVVLPGCHATELSNFNRPDSCSFMIFELRVFLLNVARTSGAGILMNFNNRHTLEAESPRLPA